MAVIICFLFFLLHCIFSANFDVHGSSCKHIKKQTHVLWSRTEKDEANDRSIT